MPSGGDGLSSDRPTPPMHSSRLTRSGCSAAIRAATLPPIELPMIGSGPRPIPSRKSSTPAGPTASGLASGE